MPEKRIRVEFDPYPDLSYLEQDEFSDVDPADIVSYGIIIEEECSCCGAWNHVDSVWGCDIEASCSDLTGTYDANPTTFPEPLRWALDHFDL